MNKKWLHQSPHPYATEGGIMMDFIVTSKALLTGMLMASLLSSAGHTRFVTYIGLLLCWQQASSSTIIFVMAQSNTIVPSWTGTLKLKGEKDFKTSMGTTFLIVFNWGNPNSSFNVP